MLIQKRIEPSADNHIMYLAVIKLVIEQKQRRKNAQSPVCGHHYYIFTAFEQLQDIDCHSRHGFYPAAAVSNSHLSIAKIFLELVGHIFCFHCLTVEQAAPKSEVAANTRFFHCYAISFRRQAKACEFSENISK